MSTKDQRPTLTRAFREVTLSLIGLFELYDAEPELVEATADALGREGLPRASGQRWRPDVAHRVLRLG